MQVPGLLDLCQKLLGHHEERFTHSIQAEQHPKSTKQLSQETSPLLLFCQLGGYKAFKSLLAHGEDLWLRQTVGFCHCILLSCSRAQRPS